MEFGRIEGQILTRRQLALVGVSALLVGCGSRKTSNQGSYRAVGSFDSDGRSGSGAVGGGTRQVMATRPSQGAPTLQLLWDRCHHLSKQGLRYSFGSDSPHNGGMDCSGTVQFVLKSMGYHDVPRTSYQQHAWLKSKGTLKNVGFWHSENRAYASMRPGDLVFWGGTYNSGHKVSHVEIYMGRNPKTGQQFTFGARSSRSRGLNGHGVDVFNMSRRRKGSLVGYGSLPGLRRV